MSKKILLIESDAHFAREMSSALEQKGFETRTTADGKEGLDLARDERPDAIVLCVELPKMSGYSICNKLKKDEALRSIPLVIISAEATQETFEQHKKLKTRAEDYLIKPFAPAELVNRIAALTGLPEPAADEEVVTLADVELESTGGFPLGGQRPEEEGFARGRAEAQPEHLMVPSSSAVPEEDEDLRLLDDAFENISSVGSSEDSGAASLSGEHVRRGEAASVRGPLGGDLPLAGDEISADLAPIVEADEGPTGSDERLGNEEDMALEALGSPGADEALVSTPFDEQPRPASAVRGATAQALRAAGIPLLETEPIRRGEVATTRGSLAGEPPAPAVAPPPDDRSGPRMEEAGFARRRAEAKPEQTMEEAGFARRRAEAKPEQTMEEAGFARRRAEAKPEQTMAPAPEVTRALEAKERELDASRREVAKQDAELRRLRERITEIEGRLGGAEEEIRKRDAELGSAKARLDGLSASAKRLEVDLQASREEARRASERSREMEGELAAARERAEEAERAVGDKAGEAAAALGKLEALEQELEGFRGELAAARTAVDEARSGVGQQTEELQRRVQELEAANAKNEERVVKAYQKIKGDEKLREKTRKALTIALQLLDEHGPSPEPEKDRALIRE